jgi:hypothetical protein
LLGTDFVVARMLASIPLPMLAGLIARLLLQLVPDLPIGGSRPAGGEE